MGPETSDMVMTGAERLANYIGELTKVVGHADRVVPLKDYCTGLLVTEGRKSVEPMAAVTAPAGVSAQHQKLMHFVAESSWSDERMLTKVREMVVPKIESHGPIEAWIIDDTGFPKHGPHSVGTHHQYCGQLGKQANCQVAVTLSIANHHASLPVAYRLYLPKAWTEDKKRREKAHIPREIKFKTKPQIALDQLRAACAAGIPRGVALIDGSYGSNLSFRIGMRQLALDYVAAIVSTLKVRAVPMRGVPEERMDVLQLARSLPKSAWHTITWREGTADLLYSRFARVRVRAAPTRRAAQQPEETLLIEWPKGAAKPTKYWLSTLDDNMSFEHLVDISKMRWRIERDYRDLKQEVGLGHYEGRGWRGFHHHATLCIASYGFLISERETIPPSGPCCSGRFPKAEIPDGYRPRGAPDPAAASRAKLDRNRPPRAGRGHRSNAATMPMLRKQTPANQEPSNFMTQSY